MSPGEGEPKSSRELVTLVLVEAVGSSLTPFVPVPFVDDYLLERLLRRITRKVIERAAPNASLSKPIEKAVVEGYVRAGTPPMAERAFTTAARFVVRKVALVLDVKRSHDVFGEAIAYALALDTGARLSPVHEMNALHVGACVYRATQSVGSAALELLTRAGRDAFKANEAAPESTRMGRVADAIGKQVDETRTRLDHLMRYELGQPQQPRT